MPARLPNPGGDNGQWGTLLNEFLLVSHNSNGTLRTEQVQSAGAVMSESITSIVVMSQTDYDSISPDPSVLYVIV